MSSQTIDLRAVDRILDRVERGMTTVTDAASLRALLGRLLPCLSAAADEVWAPSVYPVGDQQSSASRQTDPANAPASDGCRLRSTDATPVALGPTGDRAGDAR